MKIKKFKNNEVIGKGVCSEAKLIKIKNNLYVLKKTSEIPLDGNNILSKKNPIIILNEIRFFKLLENFPKNEAIFFSKLLDLKIHKSKIKNKNKNKNKNLYFYFYFYFYFCIFIFIFVFLFLFLFLGSPETPESRQVVLVQLLS